MDRIIYKIIFQYSF